MHHRSILCLMTILLALVTAVALLGAGLTLGAAPVSDPRLADTEQVARAFYVAVNQVVATGDPTALDGVVADDLVTHGALVSFAPGRAGLLRYLASLHATRPRLEVAVEQVMVTRDQALVRLAVRGGDEGRFLGSPLSGSVPPWSAFDALKVEGRRVVEYWSGERGLTLMEPIGEAPFTVAPPTTRVVSLDRLTVAPGDTFATVGSGEARVLIVETGNVTVTASPRDGVEAPVVERLAAGDLLSLPTWSLIDVRNEESETASVLVLAARLEGVLGGPTSRADIPSTSPPWEIEPGAAPRQPDSSPFSARGASVEPLTTSVQTELSEERTVVAVGQVMLPAGVTLPAFAAAGPHLVVVNAGIIELTANGKSAPIARGTGSYLRSETSGAGTGARLFNPGPEPAVVTIVAILPEERVGPAS